MCVTVLWYQCCSSANFWNIQYYPGWVLLKLHLLKDTSAFAKNICEFESDSYLTGVTTVYAVTLAKYENDNHELLNTISMVMKNGENEQMGEIGWVII